MSYHSAHGVRSPSVTWPQRSIVARSIPTIIGAFRAGFKTLRESREARASGSAEAEVPRTSRDMSMRVVLFGSLALVVLVMMIATGLFLAGSWEAWAYGQLGLAGLLVERLWRLSPRARNAWAPSPVGIRLTSLGCGPLTS